jgi:putative N6-adenine-specific DNA methylase
MRPLPEDLIIGSDIDADALETARLNLNSLPSGERVVLRQSDFRELADLENVTLVVNPPYGVRMGRRENVAQLIGDFGDFLKQKCTGSTAYVYVGKPELLKSVGLRTSWKKPLVNGALEGRLAKYELY